MKKMGEKLCKSTILTPKHSCSHLEQLRLLEV
ncbi:hypothetical protein CBM2631_B130001 [Cupriavidus taiwanensis]|nr:hypothetical protein CBM2631_B130001 [Cupriavidus taiwanensis]